MRFLRLGFVALMLMLPLAAGARPVMYHVYGCGCPDGSFCKDYGFIDDATGKSYMMHFGCDGSVCVYPLYGPFQPVIGSLPPQWTTPANWPAMMSGAVANTTPGAYVGLWVTTETGDTLRFRNPTDEAERGEYIAMWQGEGGGEMKIVDDGTPETRRKLNDAFDEMLLGSRRDAGTADQQITQALVHRYFTARFSDHFPRTREELQELADVASRLAATKQPIALKQSPAPTNGQRMILVPIAPELAGPVSVSDASGKTLWSGEVRGETAVSMNEYPTGMYFVRAENAKAVVVNIVR